MALDDTKLPEKARAETLEAGRQLFQAGVRQGESRPAATPPTPSGGIDSRRGPHNDLGGGAGLGRADAWNKGEDLQHKRSPGMDQALDKARADPAIQKTAQSLRQSADERLKSAHSAAMNAGEKAGVRAADGESRFHQSPGQAREQERARGR